MRNNGSLHRRVLLIREEGKWEEGRGGGVGGTRYHKSFRAKGSQLSYALKASRVSIGALSLSFSIERRIHTECRWRARRYQGRNIDNYYQRPSSRLNIFLEFKFSIPNIIVPDEIPIIFETLRYFCELSILHDDNYYLGNLIFSKFFLFASFWIWRQNSCVYFIKILICFVFVKIFNVSYRNWLYLTFFKISFGARSSWLETIIDDISEKNFLSFAQDAK